MENGKKCMIAGCQNIAIARDLCDKHRKRVERHGHALDTRSSDWGARERHPLYRCWNAVMRYRLAEVVPEWRDLWKFVGDIGNTRPTAKHLLKRRDDSQPLGPTNFYWQEPRTSGSSADEKAARRDYMRAYNTVNASKLVERELRKRYGIGLDDYQRMLEAQGGVCAICGQPETRVDHRTKKVSRLAVDHDHKTGDVRGLLCHAHNNSLGHFGDDPVLLTSAIAYLAKHSNDAAAVIGAAITQLQSAMLIAGHA